MKNAIFLYFILALISCQDKSTSSAESVEPEDMPVTIEITKALLNPQKEILLSELADSVSYIPLETKDECLLRNYPFYSFSPRYIAYLNYCFDWSGKFLFKVGNLGQGPGEEPADIISQITYSGDNFYTSGQKIIEYDSLSFFTGKERSLFSVNKSEFVITNKNLANIVAFNSSKDKLLLYNFPDTVFVMNKNLEFVSKHFVMPWHKNRVSHFLSWDGPYDRFMTNYKEDVLFYNYFRDTVFQVSGAEFSPRWIIKFDELKLPDDALYKFEELFDIAFKDYQGGQLDNTPLAKLMDHKYSVSNVYESNNYVFITAGEIIAFRPLRKVPASPAILICYDKKKKKIKSTVKIKDDLTGYPNFFMRCGLVGEKMIDFFWPYEQEEWLKEKAKTDPRFSRFAGRDFSEDNPIVIVVHLKK